MQLPPPFVTFRVFQTNAIVTCRYTSGFQPWGYEPVLEGSR